MKTIKVQSNLGVKIMDVVTFNLINKLQKLYDDRCNLLNLDFTNIENVKRHPINREIELLEYKVRNKGVSKYELREVWTLVI